MFKLSLSTILLVTSSVISVVTCRPQIYAGYGSTSSSNSNTTTTTTTQVSSDSGISNLASQLIGTDPPTSFTLFSSQKLLSSTLIQIISNSTHSLVSFNFSSPSLTKSFGWIGLGFGGNSMATAEQIVIAWPDPVGNGNWIISNRKATGHSEPQPIQTNPPILLSSISSAPNSLNYLIPTNSNIRSSESSFIYAFSSSKISDSDPSTDSLKQHDDGSFGSFTANLINNAGLDSNGQPTTTTTDRNDETSQPLTKFDQLIILHAIMASTAWLLISPAAILIGRLGRHLGKTWFNIHWAFQVLLTTLLTVAAIVMAILAVLSNNGGITLGVHQIMGFVILTLVICQISLGYYIHKKLDANRVKRPIRNIAHICMGITITVLAYAQVHSGLTLYSNYRTLPSYLFTLYWILAISPASIYFMSIIALIVSRRKEGMTKSFAIFGLGRVDGHEIPGGPNGRKTPNLNTDLEKGGFRSEGGGSGKGYFNMNGNSQQFLPKIENQFGGSFMTMSR